MNFQVASDWGDGKFVKVEVEINPKSSNLIIFLHGAYGYPYHTQKTKYQILFENLIKNSSVGLYQTARNFDWKDRQDLTFEEYFQQSFEGKTFDEELSDVRKSISSIISSVSKEIQRKNLNIILVGFSLGGIFSMLLSKDIPEVKTIITIGTSLKFDLPDFWIVVNTMPSEAILKKELRGFSGNVHVVVAGSDDTQKMKNAFSIFDNSTKSLKRSITLFDGVDHRFQSINGVKKENDLNKEIEKIIKLYI